MLDLSRVREISKGDNKFFKKLVSTFIEELELGLANYEKFLNEGNEEKLRKVVHNFSSSCNIFDVQDFFLTLKKGKDLFIQDKNNMTVINSLLAKAKNMRKGIVMELKSYM